MYRAVTNLLISHQTQNLGRLKIQEVVRRKDVQADSPQTLLVRQLLAVLPLKIRREMTVIEQK